MTALPLELMLASAPPAVLSVEGSVRSDKATWTIVPSSLTTMRSAMPRVVEVAEVPPSATAFRIGVRGVQNASDIWERRQEEPP